VIAARLTRASVSPVGSVGFREALLVQPSDARSRQGILRGQGAPGCALRAFLRNFRRRDGIDGPWPPDVLPFGLRPREPRSDALAHADRLDVRNRREDPNDHIAERPEGCEVRFSERNEIDARRPEPMKDVDGVLDPGPRESVQGPEYRDIEPSLVRGLEESLQLRLAVFPAHVLIDVLPDDLPSLARRVLAKLRDLIHGFLAVRRDARVDRGLHGSVSILRTI